MASSPTTLRQRFGRSDLPGSFWYLWLGTIINRLGGFAAPFLILYLTARLGMAPASAALLVSVLGAGSLGGLVFQRYGSDVLWALTFVIGVVVAVGYMLLAGPAHRRSAMVPTEST